MTQIIKFICPKELLDFKEIYPVPISHNMPEWYKKLDMYASKSKFITPNNNKTIKACMPFLDTLTSGYALKLCGDMKLIHNMIDPNKLPKARDSFQVSAFSRMGDFLRNKDGHDINVNTQLESHPTSQVKGNPAIEKNKNQPFHKILNPFIIKTTPGYSTLFVPPLNNRDDRFEIISGIVDTDTFELPINFPFIVNGDKYEELDTTLKTGLIYAQAIPFKRDSWKMQVVERNVLQTTRSKLKFYSVFEKFYKKIWWHKKSFK